MMKKCDLTNQYMLDSSDIGTVEVIDNTIFSLCEKPIENIPCNADTQLLSIKPTNKINLTTVDMPINTKYLKHNDFMEFASKISDCCKRNYKYGTIVSGIMLKMLDIAKGHEASNIGSFEESLEKSFPQLIQKYTLAFKPVKTNQYNSVTELKGRTSNQVGTMSYTENFDSGK